MAIRDRFCLSAALSLSALLAVAHPGSVRAENTDQSVWPTSEWLTSTPEEQGMDSAALAKLVAYGESHDFDSLLVVRHGRIVTEAYYAPYTGNLQHEIFSSTKAVIGTLVGIMYKDGVLDRLDHPMLDFFSDRRVANVDDRKQAITVQDLLDMTSGLDWTQGFQGEEEITLHEMYRSSNWTQFILDRAMARVPGEIFNYSNGDPNLVSAIITRLTGKLAEDYAREKLFEPLGITNWHWEREPEGLSIGDGFLTLLPRDMAKIGYLYLRHGQWEGKQLLPPGWADVLSHTLLNTHASDDPNLSYSNFIWVFPDKHVFMASGLNGQDIFVFPDLDVVAVTTAREYVRFRTLIGGVAATVKSEAALPPNPDGADLLANTIKDAAVEKPSAVSPTPELASMISGKTYKFPDNDLGLKSLTLFLTGPNPHLEYASSSKYPLEYASSLKYPPNASVTYRAPIGLNGLFRQGAPALNGLNPGHIPALKGTWLNRQTFEIDSEGLGQGRKTRYRFSFDGAKLHFHFAPEHEPEVSVDGEQSDPR
ncbi:putative Beta-lactamase [Bradyrhizobium sp. STM 3843]|uniref:serine hydrolase domain-containing protein n=1 Tax=Bradyrhizobium sp. STM 3843 TaxID=551947 RepID=UPI00024076B6|nr:serine hydrolase [Bradyrhizobium sp. STM 3843]CCE07002.1 putative Beta-lactamase [Bradyrhizobium sp. STM 3843]